MHRFARTSWVLLLFGTACTPRPLPTTFPPSSPASVEAAPAPVPAVTSSLDGDPPLPGEPLGPWQGLADEAPAPEPSTEASHAGGHHAH